MDKILRDIYVCHRDLPITIEYPLGSNAIPLIFNIRDYTIPEGAEAFVYLKKPSGAEIYNEAVIDADAATVTVNVTTQMTAEAGKCPMTVRIKVDDVIMHSFTVPLYVVKTAYSDNAIASKDEFDALDTLINEADETLEKVNEATDNAITAADNANTAADNAKEATDNANAATDAANTATDKANAAAEAATDAANSAITAAENANIAADSASEATNNANDATEAANEAAEKANDAAASATDAAESANTAADNANAAAEAAREAANQYLKFELDSDDYGLNILVYTDKED